MCFVRAISAFCLRICSTCLPAGERSVVNARSKACSMSGSRLQLASMQSFFTASEMALTWMSRMPSLLLGLARGARLGHLGEELLRAPRHVVRRHVLLV